MLSSGVSLHQSILELCEQSSSVLKKILGDLANDIKKGTTISKSLLKYEKELDPLFINMIKIGEESGTLEESLKHLASQLEASYELKKKVKGAMIYPALVLGATLAIGFGLAIFVLPKLLTFFKSMNVELPLVTRILLASVANLEKYGLYYIGGLILFVILTRLALRIKRIKLFLHRLLIEMPIFGKLVKKVNLAYFSRTLATLLKSGVTIVEALEISAATLNNLAYKETLEKSSDSIREGKGLGVFLRGTSHIIPNMMIRMIEIGEKSGSLEETLFYIADFYEKDVDATTKNLANILEPILLIGVGLIVGTVAISILMPIYQFTSDIQVY
jgi:type IV pilus assembly protein PilC